MHRCSRSLLLACAAALALATPCRAADSPAIAILVLKEHGVGSPTLAQPYVDRFVALAAQKNDWKAARGQYLRTRETAEAFVKANDPHYGILSLPAFLALRGPHRLEVIGRVASTLAGGEQYFIVSKTVRDLEGCKGKSLASDHAADVRFVERVIARGAFTLAEFELIPTTRPLLSLKQVLGGEVACALIDDAQLAELGHLKGGAEAHVVWKSAKLPPMAVVAFRSARPAERRGFQASLQRICKDDGQTACVEVGIRALEEVPPSEYVEVISLYGS